MADGLQNVTKLELLNHYPDSGSITLINENDGEREKAGTGEWPARRCCSPRSSPEAHGRESNSSSSRWPGSRPRGGMCFASPDPAVQGVPSGWSLPVFVNERSRSPASPRSPARPRQRSGKIKGQRLGEREGPRGATSCCCRLPFCCFPGLPRSLPTCSFMPQALCTPVTGKAVHSIRRRKPSRASACCLSPGSAVSCQQCGSLSFLSWVS